MDAFIKRQGLDCRKNLQLFALLQICLSIFLILPAAASSVSQSETSSIECGRAPAPAKPQESQRLSQKMAHYFCPSFSEEDRYLINTAVQQLECTKSLKPTEMPNCLPAGIVPKFNLQSELGPIGFSATEPSRETEHYVFFGTRSIGPHLPEAVTGDIFKTAELEKTIRLMFEDLSKDKKVALTGHSQGAVSAQVAAYFAAKKYFQTYNRYPKEKLSLVTFGSPGALEVLKMLDPDFDPKVFEGMKFIPFAAEGDLVTALNTPVKPSYIIPLPPLPPLKFPKYSKKNQTEAERQEPLSPPIIDRVKRYLTIKAQATHRIHHYYEMVQSGKFCESSQQPLKPLVAVKSEKNIFATMARYFEPAKPVVEEVLQRYYSELRQCDATQSVKDRNSCVDAVFQANKSIMNRLINANPKEQFKFDPLDRKK